MVCTDKKEDTAEYGDVGNTCFNIAWRLRRSLDRCGFELSGCVNSVGSFETVAVKASSDSPCDIAACVLLRAYLLPVLVLYALSTMFSKRTYNEIKHG